AVAVPTESAGALKASALFSAQGSDVRYEIPHRVSQIGRGVILMGRIPVFGQLRQVDASRQNEALQHLASRGGELGMCCRIHARYGEQSAPSQLLQSSLCTLRWNSAAARELEW